MTLVPDAQFLEEAGIEEPYSEVPPPVVYSDPVSRGPEMGFVRTFKALPLNLSRGDGSWVWDCDGRRYLDMYSGHAVASTGHAHPHVVEAIAGQASRLIFYSNVVDLDIRKRAVEKLLSFISSPDGITHALFANSGAEAIENALKMAVLQTRRKKIVAFEGGFHGRTLLATNVTGNPKYRGQAPYALDQIEILPFGDVDALHGAIDEGTAAVVVEPVQSMAGCRTASAAFFRALRELTANTGTYLVFDEIQTGIGRTGRMFFAGTHDVLPDIVCLAKGIGSGFPLSAVLVTSAIAERIEYGQFGATYGAGPMAMAAMLATLEVIEREGLLANVSTLADRLVTELLKLPGVEAIDGLGFLIGIRTKAKAADIQKRLLDAGVIVGTSDDPFVVRLLPPLVLSADEAAHFLSVFARILEDAPR